jgi:hypothetical protein
MPWISSQLSFNSPAMAFRLAALSHSIASNSNSAVNQLGSLSSAIAGV